MPFSPLLKPTSIMNVPFDALIALLYRKKAIFTLIKKILIKNIFLMVYVKPEKNSVFLKNGKAVISVGNLGNF